MGKRNNTLSNELLKIEERHNKEEFAELVKKGILNRRDYETFIICKYCNNKIDGSCTSSPNEQNKCTVITKFKNKVL